MRFLVVLGALAVFSIGDAQIGRAFAAEGPWCALFWGGDDQYEDCSMRSFETCLAEIRGTGGNTLCSPNPHYHAGSAAPAPRLKRHRAGART
jgi:hypothetical protein